MSNNEPTAVVAMYGNCYDSPLVDLMPLQNIPVECEDAPIHDGINPCGDLTCYCAVYGYTDEVQA
jgi:hypothetical protein